ncbi:MAG: GFA family protein [Pseudomonadota bacterium]|nr:GFA family protein [Pseudomonadota bacterium]
MSGVASCHCGKLRLRFAGEPGEAVSCNCSICRRKGWLLTFLPASDCVLETPREQLATYTFREHKIRHHFCPTCGCAPFAEGAKPDGSEVFAVNLRCVDGLDLDALTIRPFDGASIP